MKMETGKPLRSENGKKERSKTMARADIFKEYIECETKEDEVKAEMMLREKGYDMFDIYVGNYQGKDGKFHREVFVFK